MDTFYVEKIIRRWRKVNQLHQHEWPEVYDFDVVYVDDESMAIIDAMVMQYPASAPAVGWPQPDDPDTRWPGMERGILFVFPEPKLIGHLITSTDISPQWEDMTPAERLGDARRHARYFLPPDQIHEEFDPIVAVWISAPIMVDRFRIVDPRTNQFVEADEIPVVETTPEERDAAIEKLLSGLNDGGEWLDDVDGEREGNAIFHSPGHGMLASRIFWLHERNIITDGQIPWGRQIRKNPLVDHIAHGSRFERALVEYVGTPTMAVLSEPRDITTRQRKQLARVHSSVRVLSLRRTEASVPEDGAPRSVEWTKRWIVRGHWRNQAYGPGLTLRKLKYIFPFVKGPDDKPLDVRPTVFGIEEPG